MNKVERNYEFRERINQVHFANRRDAAVKASANEVEVTSAWKIVYPADGDARVETCAGGGNRMDPGLFRRADSAWMSDNVWIHTARSYQRNLNVFVPGYSNSLFRPWVPFETIPMDHLYSRFAGALGFSERAKNFSESAKEKMKIMVRKYKEIRHLLMKDYHRLFVPVTLAEPDGWQFHDPETKEGIFAVFRCDSPSEHIPVSLKFTDCGTYEAEDIATGKTFQFTGGKDIEIVLSQKSDAVLYHYYKIS